MNSDAEQFRREVRIAFQVALWDMVTPNLRAVAVSIPYPIIRARLLFDSFGEEEWSIVDDLEGQGVAVFASPVRVGFAGVALPPGEPRELKAGEFWVYGRRESAGRVRLRDRPERIGAVATAHER